MAKKTATTGNKRKTIKELQYHIDCYEKQINNQKYIIYLKIHYRNLIE